jgi:GAF domain-containing protein
VTQPIDFDVMTPGDGEGGPGVSKSDRQLLTTLFALGREVASVLDLDELYRKLPGLIARITDFHAMAVYLIDARQGDLRIAYAEGYPHGSMSTRLKLGEGLVGRAVEAGRPLLANDVADEPHYIDAVPGTRSELVMPLRRKGRTIGALNLLSRNVGEFAPAEVETLRNFAAAVAVAIENAQLFASELRYSETIETLAELSREFAGILELNVLLERIATRLKRLIDYRTFGILLVDEETGMVRMRHAVNYDDRLPPKAVKIGEGLVGYAALHKVPILVDDVSKDPRYIKVVEDARSELVVPLLAKDRCVGLFDLESPELAAFTKEHLELLTPLAAGAAVAIDNARLYEELRRNKERLAKEVAFAQTIQRALLPTDLPKRIKGVDVAMRLLRLPGARAVHAHGGRGRCVGQGRARGPLQRVRERAGAVAHVPPPLHESAHEPGRHPRVDEYDPPRAPARLVLLHALLRPLRLQAPHGDDGEQRAAVSHPRVGGRHEAGAFTRRAARIAAGHHLRRDDHRPWRGRRVRLFLGRHLGGDERGGRRVRHRAARRRHRAAPDASGQGHCRRHLRGGLRVLRGRGAE